MAKKQNDEVKNNLIFTDDDKHDRAIGIFNILNGKSAPSHLRASYSNDGMDILKQRFVEIFAEADKKLTDPDAILFIYRKLGGGVITPERQEKLKKLAERNNIAKTRKPVKEDEDDDEAGDADEDDDDKDEDEE